MNKKKCWKNCIQRLLDYICGPHLHMYTCTLFRNDVKNILKKYLKKRFYERLKYLKKVMKIAIQQTINNYPKSKQAILVKFYHFQEAPFFSDSI